MEPIASKHDFPKVSVLIPTYNQDQYIQQAIVSALQQTYTNLEVIVADDASTDKTEDIVSELHDSRLRYYKHSANLGRVANYKYGLEELATGDLVLNLDGDDYLSDKFYIEDAVALWKTNSDVVLVFAKCATFFEHDATRLENNNTVKLPEVMDGNWLFLNYYKSISMPHMTCLFDRKKALQIDFYRKNILSADWESLLRLIQGHRVGFVDRSVSVWRKHSSNASRTIDLDELMNNAEYITGVYGFAKASNNFASSVLDHWRRKMLKRWFLNALMKTLFLEKTKTDKLLLAIKVYDYEIYRSIVFDLRWCFLRFFGANPTLLRFVFHYVFKQKSFIKDLQSVRT